MILTNIRPAIRHAAPCVLVPEDYYSRNRLSTQLPLSAPFGGSGTSDKGFLKTFWGTGRFSLGGVARLSSQYFASTKMTRSSSHKANRVPFWRCCDQPPPH